MSVGPRIVFTRFATGVTPKLQPWRDHSRRVVGGAAANESLLSGPDAVRVVWQVVSANNRMLARSALVYASFDDAVVGVRAAVAAEASLDVVLVSDERLGAYGWYVTLGGNAVMTCARWYVTERDRRHSIDLALSSLVVALLMPGARLMDPALMVSVRERL